MSALATKVVAISARRIVDLRALELVAALEAGNDPDVARAEGRLAADMDRAKTSDRTRRHWQRQGRKVGLVIDLDVLLADLGFGKALLAERGGEGHASCDHVFRNDRVTGLDGKCIAKLRRILACSLEAGQFDRGKAILSAGLGAEYHSSAVPLRSVRASTSAS